MLSCLAVLKVKAFASKDSGEVGGLFISPVEAALLSR